MIDWDFLYDMQGIGYSADELEEAAVAGYALRQAKFISFGDQPKGLPAEKTPAKQVTMSQTAKEVQAMAVLRPAGILSPSQFLVCKVAIRK